MVVFIACLIAFLLEESPFCSLADCLVGIPIDLIVSGYGGYMVYKNLISVIIYVWYTPIIMCVNLLMLKKLTGHFSVGRIVIIYENGRLPAVIFLIAVCSAGDMIFH